METIVEICAGSYEDCITAYMEGAKRVELNSAISVGGLTPTLATLIRVKKDTNLKVICMVRPRAGGFCYRSSESEIMFQDAKILLENGADGIAFGFLKPNHQIDEKNTKIMTDLIHTYHKEAVFHRAFDVCSDPDHTISTLIDCHVDRVLTSGLEKTAMEGAPLIKYLQTKYGNQIEILAGSGINYENVADLIKETGISQVHSSCKNYALDASTIGNHVSYAYLPYPHEMDFEFVDKRLVKKIVNVVNQMK